MNLCLLMKVVKRYILPVINKSWNIVYRQHDCCCFVTKLFPTLCDPSGCGLLSRVRLFGTTRAIARQTPLSMGFPRQEYRSGLPFPSPGDLPDPGIEPESPAWQAYSLLLRHLGSRRIYIPNSIF